MVKLNTDQRIRLRRKLRALDWVVAQAVLLMLRLARIVPVNAAINFGGFLARTLGPRTKRHSIAEANLARALPMLSAADRRRILAGMWENLGRTGFEYAFLDKIFDFDPWGPHSNRFEVDGAEKFLDIRDSGKPAIFFAGHLANWELLAVCANAFDLNLTSLFRTPNNSYLAQKLLDVRRKTMGDIVPSSTGAVYELSAVLERGGRIGLLVDQYFRRGPIVSFFGRDAPTNPTLGMLARRFDCPIYGARAIRKPGGRFRLELHGPFDMPRDANGEVDVAGTMQTVTGVIEAWVREHPEQWLWIHRRWEK